MDIFKKRKSHFQHKTNETVNIGTAPETEFSESLDLNINEGLNNNLNTNGNDQIQLNSEPKNDKILLNNEPKIDLKPLESIANKYIDKEHVKIAENTEQSRDLVNLQTDSNTIETDKDLEEFDKILENLNENNPKTITLDDVEVLLNDINEIEEYQCLDGPELVDIESLIPSHSIKPNSINNYGNNENYNTIEANKGDIISELNLESNKNENVDEAIQNEDIITIDSDDSQTLNLDAISINSSEKDELDNFDSDCGYHSSDFEFITEEEAKMDGLIIKFTPKPSKNNTNITASVKTMQISLDESQNQPGPSKYPQKYLNYKKQNSFKLDLRYRKDHKVPENDEYLNLFQGLYCPAMMSEVYFFENKSVRSSTRMHIDYDGIGFDRQLIGKRRESSDNEFKDEANESAQMIRSMYPGENKKRSRRH